MRGDYLSGWLINRLSVPDHDPRRFPGPLSIRVRRAGLILSFVMILTIWAIPPAAVWGGAEESASITGRIPDTGQTTCHDQSGEIPCPAPGEAYYGQDACYAINPPSFTKLDQQGNDLPDTAESWAMVRDNLTGLIWEVKTPYESIHYQEDRMTWQEALDYFIATLNSSALGGFTDWRLPTIKEWSQLVNHGRTTPALDTFYFPYSAVGDPGHPWSEMMLFYWTSTVSSSDPDQAWSVYMSHGSGGLNKKSFICCVRAVRGQSPAGSLLNNGDGTVSDLSTGLMWQQQPGNDRLNWAQALALCEDLVLAGYEDWRLPNFKELRSIVDYTAFSPAVDQTFFPHIPPSQYWSSTTFISPDNQDCAWGIDLDDGDDFFRNKTETHYVWAVRGGE